MAGPRRIVLTPGYDRWLCDACNYGARVWFARLRLFPISTAKPALRSPQRALIYLISPGCPFGCCRCVPPDELVCALLRLELPACMIPADFELLCVYLFIYLFIAVVH
jgi:hypothetical protein